jgi:NTE family protein
MVLSGGANNGAWELGVMWGLAHYGDPEDYFWDVATGVSAGSINTAYMSAFAPEDVLLMTESYSDLMQNTVSHDIWKNWPGGPLEGLLFKRGLLNTEPFFDYVDGVMDGFSEFKRRFAIASANVATGEYEVFTQDNIEFLEVGVAAVSSSSIPGVFPPTEFKGMTLMDGGTIWDVNMESAV